MKHLLCLALLLTPVSDRVTAPVYLYFQDGMMRRAGTYTYKDAEGYTVLYCVGEEAHITLHCVVRTPEDMLVLVDVTATEQKT